MLVLEPLVKFGERVVPLIREDATARAWYLNEHLLIHAHHWRALARRVMNFVKKLGLLAEKDNNQQSKMSFDDIKLLNVGRRAVEIYSVYATEDRGGLNSKLKQSAQYGESGLSNKSRSEQIGSGFEQASGISFEPRRLAAGERGGDSLKRRKPNPIVA